MKLKLLILFMVFSSIIFAEEFDLNKPLYQADNKINYYNFEVINNLPIVGLGVREAFGQHGYDFNISFDPICMARFKFQVIAVLGNLNYLYSFSKNLNSFYTGIGINSYTEVLDLIINEYINPCLLLGIHFSLFDHMSFAEIKGNWLTFVSTPYNKTRFAFFTEEYIEKVFYMPFLTVRFGVGF